MEEMLLIPIMDFDPNWMMKGYESSLYALEYCEHILQIPPDYILDSYLGEEGIELSLLIDENILTEDWYLQVKRLAMYEDAS
jgi:hypothetical protein